MSYGIMALRGAVDQAYHDCINGHGLIWAYRNARLALDMALAQRDNDRRDARLLRALRFVAFPLVARVRAAMGVVGDGFARARARVKRARALVAANRFALTTSWLAFARADAGFHSPVVSLNDLCPS